MVRLDIQEILRNVTCDSYFKFLIQVIQRKKPPQQMFLQVSNSSNDFLQ